MNVQAPDGKVIQFPDTMSQSDVEGSMGKLYPQPSEIAQPTDSLPPLDPRTATTGDYLAHLHQLGSGLGQIGSALGNMGRVAANVYGIGDQTLASTGALGQDLTGQRSDLLANLAAERAKTEAAAAALPPEARVAASMAGAGPVGALGIGKGVAGAAAPYIPKMLGGNWLAGVLGGGTEGATLAGAGAFMRGDPVMPAVKAGGIGGAAFALPGGVTNRGVLPATPTADNFDQAANSVYKDMRQVGFHPPYVNNSINQARPTLTASQDAGLTPGFLRTVRNQQSAIAQSKQTTADDINGYARNIKGAVSSAPDSVLAARIAANLRGTMENVPPVTGHSTGYAADLQDEANQYIGQRNDLQRLSGFQQKADVARGKDVATQTSDWLQTAQGQRFAPPGSPQYEAWNTLGGTTARPGLLPNWAKHYVLAPIVGFGASEGVGALTGDTNSPPSRIAEDIGMALAFGGGSKAYAAGSGARRGAEQQRAIDAVRATIGTGQLYKPLGAPAPVRGLLQGLYRQAAPSMPLSSTSLPSLPLQWR
jgi:hypothetical protein